MADKRSFEEQVREQLGNLNMQPGAAVWENVGSALKEDRKRRWVLWIFLLVGAVSAATYGVYRAVEQPQKTFPSNIAWQKNETSNKPADTKKENETVEAVPKDNSQVNAGKRPGMTQTVRKQPVNRPVPSHNKKPIFSSAKNNDLPAVMPAGNNNTVPVTGEAVVLQSEIRTSQEVPESLDRSKEADSLSSPVTTAGKKNTALKPKRPWKLNAIVNLGQSNLISTQVLFYNVNASLAPGSSFNNSLAGGSNFYSDKTTAAFSYRLGLEAQKAIGKKWDIGFSLAYQSLATKINAGGKVDSLLSVLPSGNSSYYLAANDNGYTNHYHFFQAGISVYRQFNPGKNLSLRWQAGIEGNWLFSSSALYFNPALGILYNDGGLSNKVQTGLSTGFELGIGKTPALYFGPAINYLVTDYYKPNAAYDVRHLWNVSLQLHVPLSRNKK